MDEPLAVSFALSDGGGHDDVVVEVPVSAVQLELGPVSSAWCVGSGEWVVPVVSSARSE